MPPRLSIANESNQRLSFSPTRLALSAMLEELAAPDQTLELLFANDAKLKELNRRFRGIDEATDVLSFPAPTYPVQHLGEVAVSVDYAVRGARRRGVSKSEEAAFLALHGALHLVGYDDEMAEDRDHMVQAMNRYARAAGLKPDEGWASVPHGGPV